MVLVNWFNTEEDCCHSQRESQLPVQSLIIDKSNVEGLELVMELSMMDLLMVTTPLEQGFRIRSSV